MGAGPLILHRYGMPFGRHSRPPIGSLPSCSRFLVSTLITGSPAAW